MAAQTLRLVAAAMLSGVLLTLTGCGTPAESGATAAATARSATASPRPPAPSQVPTPVPDPVPLPEGTVRLQGSIQFEVLSKQYFVVEVGRTETEASILVTRRSDSERDSVTLARGEHANLLGAYIEVCDISNPRGADDQGEGSDDGWVAINAAATEAELVCGSASEEKK